MNPSGVLEVATLPLRAYLHVGIFLLLNNPVMNELLAHLLLQHRFDGLEIVVEVRAVDVQFALHTHDGAYFAVLSFRGV